jgi:hypothetical protein
VQCASSHSEIPVLSDPAAPPVEDFPFNHIPRLPLELQHLVGQFENRKPKVLTLTAPRTVYTRLESSKECPSFYSYLMPGSCFSNHRGQPHRVTTVTTSISPLLKPPVQESVEHFDALLRVKYLDSFASGFRSPSIPAL